MNGWADRQPRANHLGSVCWSTTKLHTPAPEGAESRSEMMPTLTGNDRSGAVHNGHLHRTWSLEALF